MLFDITGNRISTLLDQDPMHPGSNVVVGNMGQLPPGVYLLTLKTGTSLHTVKMVKTE